MTGVQTCALPISLSAAGDATLAAVAAALADAAHERVSAPVGASLPGGWRNIPSQAQQRTYAARDDTIDVAYRWGRHGLTVDSPRIEGLSVVSATPDEVVVDLAGVTQRLRVQRAGDAVHVSAPDGPSTLTRMARFVDPADSVAVGALVAPMPGSVVRVAVAVGDRVEAGTPLLWLAAMKMEHVVAATCAGVVTQVVEVGRQVEPGTVLAVISGEEAGE